MPRTIRDVVFVDGVRTPFGKAGPKGIYHETRADDLVVKAIRELLRRNPDLDPKKIDEVAIAATTQIGDQGLTLGRTAGILAGLPQSVPGYSIDRMCAGALTAVTSTAGSIAFGAYDVVVAGGVEHMGRHPMGEGVDPNPRFVSEKLVDESALFMGMTAENLHDRYPTITKERADAYAVRSQEKAAKAYANGKIQQDLVPVSVRRTNAEAGETGWGLVTADEPMRPGTTMESLAGLKTPSAPTAASRPVTPRGSTTAPPPRCSPPRTSPASWASRSRCAWSRTPSRASSRRSWATARSRPPRRRWPRPV